MPGRAGLAVRRHAFDRCRSGCRSIRYEDQSRPHGLIAGKNRFPPSDKFSEDLKDPATLHRHSTTSVVTEPHASRFTLGRSPRPGVSIKAEPSFREDRWLQRHPHAQASLSGSKQAEELRSINHARRIAAWRRHRLKLYRPRKQSTKSARVQTSSSKDKTTGKTNVQHQLQRFF